MECSVLPPDLSLNQVLVTGSSGWLGRRLVEALAAGLPDDSRLSSPPKDRKIRGLDVVESGRNADSGHCAISPRGPSRSGNSGAIRRGARDAVLIHTAGVIHPRRVREFYEVNVEGTRTLLEAAAAAGVRRAVVVSSNSPCGCNPSRDHRFDESSPYQPYMNYGRSKMLMEQAVHAVQQSGRIETVIVRPPWFYGPYQPPRQSLFFRMIRDGKAPIVGDGENLRSMAYIDNLCQGLILAASNPEAAAGPTGSPTNGLIPMNEIVDTVERLLETEFGIPCAISACDCRRLGERSRLAGGQDAAGPGPVPPEDPRPVRDEQDDRLLRGNGEARTGVPTADCAGRRDARSIRWRIETAGEL